MASPALRIHRDDGKAAQLREVKARITEQLEAIPTLFGRIAKASNAWNSRTGLYEWDSLGEAAEGPCTPAEISGVVERIHEELVMEWLNKQVRYQAADMAAHFRRDGAFGLRKLWTLQDRRDYRHLLPVSVPKFQAQHFQLEMTIVLPLAAARLE